MDKQKTIDITGRLGQPSPSGRATAQHARSEGTHYGKDRLGISTDLDAPPQTAPRPALQAYTPDMCPADAQRRTVPTGEQVDKKSDLAAVPSGHPVANHKRIVILVVAGVVALAAAWGLWSWLGGSSSTPQRAGAMPAPPAIPTTPVTPDAPKPPQAAPAVVPPVAEPASPTPAEVGGSRLTPPLRPAPRRAKAWLAPSRRPKAPIAPPLPEGMTPTGPAPGEAPKPNAGEHPEPPKPESPAETIDEKATKPAKRFRNPPAGITLGGVASFGDQRFADINGKLLTVGDTINGATLVKVGDMHVEMEIDGEHFQIEVGGASVPNGQEGEDSSDKTSGE